MNQSPLEQIEHRFSVWGIRPDLLAVIARAMRGELAAEELETLQPQAARRQARVSGDVAVLSLKGVLRPQASLFSLLFGGGGGLSEFRASLRDALGNDEVGSILIEVDSPGGVTDLIPETAAEILAARGKKRIVAVANTMAASAAYWLASQADELVVTPSGEVGSIGVFAAHEDWSKFDEQMGVATTLISAGKFKTEGNPFEPLSEEGREHIQATVDEFYGLFVADVAKGRGQKVSAVRSGYGEGRLVTAKQALNLGMVDRVETFERTLGRLTGSPSGRTQRGAVSASEKNEHAAIRGLRLALPRHF